MKNAIVKAAFELHRLHVFEKRSDSKLGCQHIRVTLAAARLYNPPNQWCEWCVSDYYCTTFAKLHVITVGPSMSYSSPQMIYWPDKSLFNFLQISQKRHFNDRNYSLKPIHCRTYQRYEKSASSFQCFHKNFTTLHVASRKHFFDSYIKNDKIVTVR